MTTGGKSIFKLLILSIFVVLSFTLVANVFAADAVTVDIVSFTRGPQEDLRSSELLEARVTGYDGNVRELTYKWTSSLGTYLYVYNSHNMYGINNTDGEIEIYNTSKNLNSLGNMAGRNYNKTFTGVGYAWASVYGADISIDSLVGTITVEVYAPDGTLLASDSHTGTKVRDGNSWWWGTYVNKGIVASDLAGDVEQVSFGMFEGDTKNVRILLGESSIVHITCEECFVSDAKIVKGSDIISITLDKKTKEYHISSVKADASGEAQINITIEKGNCKFHKNTKTTKVIKVYSYKKPTTTSTSTVITLDNLDENCRYFIGGIEGVDTVIDGKKYVIFEGLTPNTEYQVEVVGKTPDTEAVYAYVYETTKPAHVGTIEVILNGTYNTSTGEAIGKRVDIQTVMPNVETLYLRYEDSVIYFPLKQTATGVYSSELADGTYTVYYSEYGSSEKIRLGDQYLTISGASRTRELFFNSVDYDTAGGTPDFPTEYYLSDSKVMVSKVVPEKDGYLFTHWTCPEGHVHKSGEVLTEALGQPYQLTACYVDAFDVYVDIVIRHLSEDGSGRNNDKGMHDITFTVDQRFGGAGDYKELLAHSIAWDGVSKFTDPIFDATYLEQNGLDRTIYEGIAPVLVNVAKDAEYTVTSTKSGYARNLKGIIKEIDENGDLRITIEFVFDPNDFDLAFEIELDEKSKKVADELKPVAVNVKVISWFDPPGDDSKEVMWTTITQMPHTYERIALDENGYGSGTYPVWMATTDKTKTPYSYRIEVVSYELKDGTIVEAINKDNENIIYHTPKNRFSTTVTVDGGNVPKGSTLNGAFYNNGTQNGVIKGVVTIETFNVTFVPNGGTLLGTTKNTVLNYQVGIPNLNDYVPEREGGYIFDGWYLADENGNMTENAAVSEEIIFENKTLIAKWREPLTVKGEIAVDATYYAQESLKEVIVLFQHINPNGYAETVKYQTVAVDYEDGAECGYASYEFGGILDDGHNHRIKVVATNYHTHYLNETSSALVNEYERYAEESEDDMYLAEFNGDKVANVHLYLHFKPDNFELQYAVDASAIGEDFRPEAAEVLVLWDTGEHIDPQHWAVISQMIADDGSYNGDEVELASGGTGMGSEPVWKMKANDNTPYHYSIRLDCLEFAGQHVEYDSSHPYMINYNGSTRYSDTHGAQTQMLTATIVPRRYTVKFDLGEVKDIENLTVGGMDSYVTVNNTLEDTYYWSHGKSITAVPEVEGYTFLGWYDENGFPYYYIPASSAENMTLTARWVANVEFKVGADAGYYSVARDSAEKEGVISLNVRITNFEAVKSHISTFGLYVYNKTSATMKTSAMSYDMVTLENDNGEYHALVSGIAIENFSDQVLAIPYVVVDGTIITAEDAIVRCVSDINKWLGPKN